MKQTENLNFSFPLKLKVQRKPALHLLGYDFSFDKCIRPSCLFARICGLGCINSRTRYNNDTYI